LGFEIIPKVGRKGGLQILQGLKPLLNALSKDNCEETFFTILQVDKWYFSPEGVL